MARPIPPCGFSREDIRELGYLTGQRCNAQYTGADGTEMICNHFHADHPPRQQVAPPPPQAQELPSPRVNASVLVIASPDFQVIAGSVSIVSRTLVLTAYHNLAKDHLKPTRAMLMSNWVVTEGVERDARGRVFPCGPTIEVKIFRRSCKDDWALLRRTDNGFFPPDDILPICPQELIPSNRSEQNLKVYHCAIDLFVNGAVSAAMPLTVDARFGFTTRHRLWAQGGLFGGSSGGVYVIKSNNPLTNGKLLAMHVESVNTALLFDSEEYTRDEIDALTAISNSCANAHASLVCGLVVCKFRELMRAIEQDV